MMMTIQTVHMKGHDLSDDWRESTMPIMTPDGHVFPTGTKYKAWETTNFGWLAIHPDAQPEGGGQVHRRLYRY
jgi:hypothetical protein